MFLPNRTPFKQTFSKSLQHFYIFAKEKKTAKAFNAYICSSFLKYANFIISQNTSIMKKIFFLAAAVALTMASCGGQASGNAADNDSTTTDTVATTEETATEEAFSAEAKTKVEEITTQLQTAISQNDSKAIEKVLTSVQTIYKQLVADGKLDDAKAYGEAIKKLITDNADKLKSASSGNTTVNDLVSSIKSLPTDAQATAEQAAEAVKSIPGEVKEAAEKAANKAVDDAKAAAKEKVDSEVKKANDKANEAVKKANDKVNDAVNKAADDAINKINSLRRQ